MYLNLYMRDLRVSTQYTGLSSFYLLLCIGGGEKLNTIDLVGSFFLTTSLPNFILPVTWTLQYELYFYFFFALLIFVTKEYRIKIIILTLVIILVVQSYAIFHLDIYAPNNFHTTSRLYIFWLSPFVIEFLLGVFVAYYFEHARIKHLFPLIFGIILLIIGALYYQNHMISGSLEQGYYMPQRVVFFGIISMLLLALMIELNQRNINIFPKISILLGNASYSLYLSHTILLLIAYGLGIRNAIKDFGAYQGELMILLIGSIILYSLLHYKFIELPLLNLSKKIRNTLFH